MVRTVELEVLPAALDYGIGILPWSPVQGGLLGGILRKQELGRSKGRARRRRVSTTNRERIEKYEAFCDELGHEPADVAVAWLLHQPAVTSPIVGPRTMEHLEGGLRALEITLDGDALRRLDELFPGPGGTAPEAYAW